MVFDKNQEISFAVRMQKNLPEVEKIRDFLLTSFAEVLTELGDEETATLVSAIGENPNEQVDPGKFAQVQSICFQIQNLVENAMSLRVTRQINSTPESKGESGFWLNYLRRLQQEGCDRQTIAKRVESSFIEVVYTKHPTEAKRWIILHLHRRLSSLILKLADGEQVESEIQEILELLWRTGELFTSKPTIVQERRNLDYYFTEVFPLAREALDQSFRDAWRQVFPDSEIPPTPFLRLATWVGGDRDGHPLVTAEVTRSTLGDLRRLAIVQLQKSFAKLKSEVRFHKQSQETPEPLCSWLSELELNPQSEEPWTLALEHIDRALASVMEPKEGVYTYQSPEAFRKDLEMLETAFRSIQANRLIKRYLDPIQNQLHFYGFHTAALDIRQNSQAYQDALVELLEKAEIPGASDFTSWPESRKTEFMLKELANNRPFLLPHSELSDNTQEVLNTFRVVKKHINRYGPEGIGNFIVSMTRDTSDLLTLYLFCKEAGLLRRVDGKMVSLIHIVPLFETMADLETSVDIMKKYLDIPLVKDSLSYLATTNIAPATNHNGMLPQTIMLGYSDSNKDCGIWASQWTVYNTQKHLIKLSNKLGVPMRFFHGRGGTVGRGSGPMHRFIEALPQSGLENGFRITEQGEVIAQKYNSVENAINSFEQLVAGVSCAKLLPTHDAIIERATPAMMHVKAASLAKYRSIIEAQGFLKFYRQATPIDVIELSKIGSRPSRRTGTPTLDDLRAIPWVFSWNQSRFYLPGWFGVGSGLHALQNEKPEDFEYLKKIWKQWPFLRYVLYNAESTVASCSKEIIGHYADLVESESIRDCFLTAVLQELELSEHMLTQVLDRPFSEGRPRLYFTLKARDQRLRALHLQQIELIRKWRAVDEESKHSGPLLTQLLQNINAVASGLKTTG